MSLKAKLEAVIYAAEEPVTLAQLSVLFAGEALEWKAARDAAQAPALPLPEESAAEAEAESLASPSEKEAVPGSDTEPAPEAAAESTPLESLAVEPLEISESTETAEEPTPEAAEETIPEVAEESAPETVEEPAAEASVTTESVAPLQAPATDPNHELAATVSAEEAEFEARRQERRRERDARETLRSILDELIAEYATDARGIEIREIAGGYRMGTKPEMHDSVRAFVKSLKPALKLSLPALETLAVIAYKQPVTAPEVGEIRGVDSAGVLGSLMSRKLIATAGRKQVVGRPMLYKTTKEFLLRFGLKDISELPSMEEFEKMAAQELSDDIADEATGQTGDLFAESETATVPEGEEATEAEVAGTEQASETTESNPDETETAAVSTAEPAEEHPVQENQATGATPDEEEIEVKP